MEEPNIIFHSRNGMYLLHFSGNCYVIKTAAFCTSLDIFIRYYRILRRQITVVLIPDDKTSQIIHDVYYT
jgi:hypothetical protein